MKSTGELIPKDDWYMGMAMSVANLSNDPSTKCGCIIVTNEKYPRALRGHNHFPDGVKETPERLNDRSLKYPRIVHAEVDAILKAGLAARGGTLYAWPLFLCSNCTKMIIQAGIRRVVTPPPNLERWQSEYDISYDMLTEAGVEVVFYDE